MNIKKHILQFALAALLIQMPMAAHAADTITLNTTGKKGGKLILTLEGNPKTFNPHLITDVPTRKTLATYVYVGLKKFNYETNQVENELAKSVEISEDGKTYTYKIRQGLKWSDGTPFTVDDVVFSWEALIHPQTLANLKDNFKLGDGTYPQVKKIDNETVQFSMSQLNVLFENDLAKFYVLPKHKWEKSLLEGQFNNILNTSTPVSDVVGMGPFMLTKYVPEQAIILERNPNYYKYDSTGVQLPYLDKVVRLLTPDFEASFVKVRNGEIDMYLLQPDNVDLLKREEQNLGLKVYELGASYDVVFYNFNLNPRNNSQGKPYVDPEKLKIFSDKRFRQAMNYATDRKSIGDVTYVGRATAIYGTESPTNKIWFNPNDKTYPFDLAKAKSMLDEMGLKDTNGDGFRDLPSGKTFEFTIVTNVENKVRINIANLLKNDFAKVGIKVGINPIPFNTLITHLQTDQDYDCVVMGWGADVPPDPLNGKNVYLSHSDMHYWNGSAPAPHYPWEKTMDDIINTMGSTKDLQARIELWKKFTALWNEELPQTMLFAVNRDIVVKTKFKNVKPSVLAPHFDWNIEEIYDDTQK